MTAEEHRLPNNWNDSTLAVDPMILEVATNTLNSVVNGINDDLASVMGVLNALRLSWTGDPDGSSANADTFNRRWSDLMTELYGTKDGSQTGIMNTLTSGIGSAAMNYSHTERRVANMFARFEAAVEGISLDPGVIGIRGGPGAKPITPGDDDSADLSTVLANTPVPDSSTSDGSGSGASFDNVVDEVTNTSYHSTSVNETF